MITATIVDATGEPIVQLQAPDAQTVALNTPPGATAVPGSAPEDAYYSAATSSWVRKPARPSTHHTWNRTNKRWDDMRSLDQAKEQAWERIKAEREQAIERLGVTSVGTFQTDAESRNNIAAVCVMLLSNPTKQTVQFTMADNSRRTIGRQQFLAAASSIAEGAQTAYQVSANLRTQINQCQNLAQVDGIEWPADLLNTTN